MRGGALQRSETALLLTMRFSAGHCPARAFKSYLETRTHRKPANRTTRTVRKMFRLEIGPTVCFQ